MPLFRRETFFLVVNQTTSKHWAQWSLYLPCCPRRDEVEMRLMRVRPLRGTWPVYFFLYWGWCGEWAPNKTWKPTGRTCGLMLWSERPFFPVNLYHLFFWYVWVRIVIYFNVYVMFICVQWPLLSLVLLLFLVLFCLYYYFLWDFLTTVSIMIAL